MIPLPKVSFDKPYLGFINDMQDESTGLSRVKNIMTGEEVVQLSGRFAMPDVVQWDRWCIVAGYNSGEVLILNFSHMVPQ